MYFSLNLSHCVKGYGHFCQILALFTMPTHQIWSCHVTQVANFKTFLFCPNSTFNITKIHKIPSGKALYFGDYPLGLMRCRPQQQRYENLYPTVNVNPIPGGWYFTIVFRGDGKFVSPNFSMK